MRGLTISQSAGDDRLEHGRDSYRACEREMNDWSSMGEDISHCPLAYGRRPTLTKDTAHPPMIRITIARNAAPPSRVSSPRNTLTHQHARPSCGLEDIVDAFNLQRRALLVRTCTDSLRNSFCLRPRDVSVNIQVITRWTQICLAAHKDYGDGGTTYGPHFFDPLINPCDVSVARVTLH